MKIADREVICQKGEPLNQAIDRVKRELYEAQLEQPIKVQIPSTKYNAPRIMGRLTNLAPR